MKKVLIGVPTWQGHSYCRIEFIEKLLSIKKNSDVPTDIFIVWNGHRDENPRGVEEYEKAGFKVKRTIDGLGERGVDLLCRKQNMIREEFLNGDYTHLLMLESDNFPPDNVVDTLLSHNVEVVSALYFVNSAQSVVKGVNEDMKKQAKAKGMPTFDAAIVIKQVPIPTIWGIFNCEIFEHSRDTTTTAVRLWSLEDYINFKIAGKRLIPVFASGVGCVLIEKSVMINISFSAKMDDNIEQLTDFIFYHNAYSMGITSYCDIECLAQHRHFSGVDSVANFKKWFDKNNFQGFDTGENVINGQEGM